MRRAVTICMAFYRNQEMLQEQCKRFRALPDGIKSALRLIVVDDGSTILQEGETELPSLARPALHEEIGLTFELYRLKVNVRWNQDAARNLAVHHAATEWLLLTDMDHIPSRALLESVTSKGEEYDPARVYRFSRVTLEKSGDMTGYKPHPNSWFLTKEMYRRIGGYDERFAGLYGTDADFKERVLAVAGEPVMRDQFLIRVPRETIPDASTSSYGRKEERDAAFKKMRQQRNATPGWQPVHLSFPWERVA